jgi:transcriptional regulator with XRE-family HTH domain
MADKKRDDLKGMGKQIRQAREEHAMTQKELAEAIGVEEMTVYRWEKGESRPHPYARRVLMKRLGLKKEIFLAQEEEPSTEEPLTQERPVIDPSVRRQELLIPPPPLTRRYKGWREKPFRPEWKSREPSDTRVTVNNYPLRLATIYDDVEECPFFDWGQRQYSPRAEQLAISLLADYFDEPITRTMSYAKQVKSFTVKFQRAFCLQVVVYLPYEEWELSSDEIALAIERINVMMQIQS